MVKYYSSINDNEFEKNTCSKKEFKKYVWQPSKNRKQQSFLLLPHQQWISNYINPKTPFKGMLVYHETGTGKTCTAISIAENFRDELIQNGKKILILCSDNIKEVFYETISNPGNSFKCTGNTYNKMIESSDMTQANLNKKIDEYYTFLTHGKFGREVEKKTKKDPAKIREQYSDSLIIIDEAQHLRGKFDSTALKEKGEKQSHDAIDMISKYANNVKIVFLTATPMYDNPVEIIWMINVLIRVNNDNIEELNPKEIFNEDKGYSFKEEGKEKFIRAIKGKVSFLRGGDPESFPLRLPDSNGSNQKKNIKKNFLGKPIDPEYFKDSSVTENRLTLSRMSKEHFNVIKERKENSINTGKSDYFHMQMMQIHNVRWYKKASKNKDDDDDINAISGLENHFKITKSGIYTPLNNEILNNLNDWAPKVNTIVNHILQMKDNGIAFVFSQFVSSGVIPIMLALESKGFSKYGGFGPNSKFNHLKIPRKDLPDRGNYIVITSNKILATSRMQEYISIARAKGNETGNKIRVIIASGAGGEGLDLKWIRQVHIMEPHFHLSQIEQAVGRAIRNKSHKELPKEKQNCTIFYHATQYPVGIDYETIDMHLYRIAMKKRHATIQVRKIIQEYSITCEFFKGVNIFDYNQYFGKYIIDSKGKKIKFTNEMIIDDGYTSKCLVCQNVFNEKETDSDTYNPNIHSKWHIFEAMKKIQQLFEISDKYSLIDIVTNIQEWNNEIDEESIYFALDIIINSPPSLESASNFENQFGVKGTIHQIDNYYVFVPQHTEYTGIYSGIPLTISNQYVPLNIIPWPNRPEIEGKTSKKDIDLILVKDYDNLIQKLIFSNDNFWSKIPEIRNQLIAEVLIDRLDPDDRKYLFFNQNILHSHDDKLLNALNRYSLKEGFIDIEGIDSQFNILDKNDSNKILKQSDLPKNSKTSRRNFFGYLDYINDKASFYVMDGRKPDKKPSGWKVLSQQKEKIIEITNYIIQIETGKNAIKLMNYPRYKSNDGSQQLKEGQLFIKETKAADLLIECEMLFRYLDKIKKNGDQNWFFSYWEAYDFGIQSKRKKINKKDPLLASNKGTTIKKTRRKLKHTSTRQTKRKDK